MLARCFAGPLGIASIAATYDLIDIRLRSLSTERTNGPPIAFAEWASGRSASLATW